MPSRYHSVRLRLARGLVSAHSICDGINIWVKAEALRRKPQGVASGLILHQSRGIRAGSTAVQRRG